MLSGVRNSCAASAVKSRWIRKPSSSRSSARLTAETSGTDLARDFSVGSRRPGRAGPDVAGDLGSLPKRSQRAAEDRDVRDQKNQEDRQRDPADVLIEIGDDVVDQHVAIGEILAGLDPDGLAADRLADAGAGDRGIASPLLQKFDIAGIGRRQETGRRDLASEENSTRP